MQKYTHSINGGALGKPGPNSPRTRFVSPLASIRSVISAADIQFWISDDGTKNGLWARQTRINIHTVFAALTF